LPSAVARSVRSCSPSEFYQPETLVTAFNRLTLSDGSMNPQINTIDFDERPFIAIWEVTQACDLACVHCRPQPSRTGTPWNSARMKANN